MGVVNGGNAVSGGIYFGTDDAGDFDIGLYGTHALMMGIRFEYGIGAEIGLSPGSTDSIAGPGVGVSVGGKWFAGGGMNVSVPWNGEVGNGPGDFFKAWSDPENKKNVCVTFSGGAGFGGGANYEVSITRTGSFIK